MPIDVNELLAPIPGSDPAGSDASFSDQFDRIREARRADDPNLAQGEWQTELKVADWREAQSLSEDILLRTSKDLQAAVWLAEAAISRDGLEGARDSFALLAGLLETYWEGLYPRADDGDLEERAGKLAWFATYGARALQALRLNDDPQAPLTLAGWIDSREVDNLGRQNAEAYQAALDEGRINGEAYDARMLATPEAMLMERLVQVQAARDAFTRFSTTSDAKLGRDAPNLAPIDDGLKKIQQVYSKVATAKGIGGAAVVADDGSAVQASAGGGATVAATGGGVALDLGGGSLASKEAALRALGEIAGFFRRTEPHSPVAYLLERAVLWANMPLEQFLAELIRDEGTLSSIRERVGLPPSY
ncbi:type VI secretion system protein TssA [Thermomonas carbonis]|uniref:Type VI secretion system protein TssA n=1 Tax=Thermomonas carbonis TaxID=1463158 RepID=A0A7G9SPU8_9GAMM|nr:type VI secretion system protein TssA [Thermomonas carbonis]QNN69873.1 type VI secretion system protein TssA [Thermomonas carbonis]GHB96023.1 type VI secretion protein ImpA [Thermomonas carbonis]